MEILIALLCGNSLIISYKMFAPLNEANPYRSAMVDTFAKYFIMFILNLIVYISAKGHIIFLISGALIGFLYTKLYFQIIYTHSASYIRTLNLFVLILNTIIILLYYLMPFLFV